MSLLCSSALHAGIFYCLVRSSEFTAQNIQPQLVQMASIVLTTEELSNSIALEVTEPVLSESKVEQAVVKKEKPPQFNKTNHPAVATDAMAASHISEDADQSAIEAQPLVQVKPEIPEELKSSEYSSSVKVKVEIDADGSARSTLRTSSGNIEVDRRVLEALERWIWKSAEVGGRPVASVRYFRFEFSVD